MYIRSVAIHNQVLSDAQVASEAATLRALVLEDAIRARAHPLMHPLLERKCSGGFIECTDDVCERVLTLAEVIAAKFALLWAALLRCSSAGRDTESNELVQQCLARITDVDLRMAWTWVPQALRLLPGNLTADLERIASEKAADEAEERKAADEAEKKRKTLEAAADETSTMESSGEALTDVARSGQVAAAEATEALLQALESPENPAAAEYRLSLLNLACFTGATALVERLLSAGADPMRRGTGTCTSLHAAAASGHPEILGKLLACGAEVESVDGFGCSALHVACQLKQTSVIRHLLAAKANLHAADHEGNTPRSLLQRQPEMAALLEELGEAMDSEETSGAVDAVGKAAKELPIDKEPPFSLESMLEEEECDAPGDDDEGAEVIPEEEEEDEDEGEDDDHDGDDGDEDEQASEEGGEEEDGQGFEGDAVMPDLLSAEEADDLVSNAVVHMHDDGYPSDGSEDL